MASVSDIVNYCNQFLAVDLYHDYAPNGLQVEGVGEVTTLISGVTASQALIEAAVERGAEALLVHHGYFWKSESPVIVGMKRRRIEKLLRHGINLIAYHLPLDGHNSIGNNARLAQLWGFKVKRRFGDGGNGGLGMIATLPEAITVEALHRHISDTLGREALLCHGGDRLVREVAWCSGGAQEWFGAAIAAGADAFISGEISEPVFHMAREEGVHYLGAGHHATERYGVEALGQQLAQQFSLQHTFVDIDNPI
ncbi:MAG: Nif3-like dinuclear metal center hexameric protein [Gammaproteobacteria bacterium]|nr:Nif3-like dinuclear metal center hexameric protein [Gammaproteobacteria bacterium]